MSSFKHIFAIITLTLTGLGVFGLKHHVTELQKEIHEIKKQITMEKDSIISLNAEWAYLNKPERIRYLAEKYLDMQPLETMQIHKEKSNIQVSKLAKLSEKPVIVGVSNRTKISDSLLSKASFVTKQKIKWDEKRNRFIQIKYKNEVNS